jgi:hypothetical protein
MIRVKFTNETIYHNVSFTRTEEHVVTLKGSDALLQKSNTSGFCTYKSHTDTQLGDFTNYNTVYRVTDTFIQYSDDGSTWEEPTRSVELNVQWDDANNADGLRPDSVVVVVNNEQEVAITAKEDWTTVLKNIPVSNPITVTATTEIEEYAFEILEQTVIYTHECVDIMPSLEERVTDAEDAIVELYDLFLTTME